MRINSKHRDFKSYLSDDHQRGFSVPKKNWFFDKFFIVQFKHYFTFFIKKNAKKDQK